MVAVRLRRTACEIALDEAVVVGGGFLLRDFEDLLIQRRQRAGRVCIAAVAGQRKSLASTAAEIDFLEFSSPARLRHPAGTAIAIEGRGSGPVPGDRMVRA